MFDNDLISRYDAGKPSFVDVDGYKIAMALRGVLSGIWKLVFLVLETIVQSFRICYSITTGQT